MPEPPGSRRRSITPKLRTARHPAHNMWCPPHGRAESPVKPGKSRKWGQLVLDKHAARAHAPRETRRHAMADERVATYPNGVKVVKWSRKEPPTADSVAADMRRFGYKVYDL